jgi:hypothetical protein
MAFGDFKVVIEQVNKEWDCVKDKMDAYYAEIRKLEGHFEGIEFQHVPRNNNVAVDVLSKLGSRRALVPAGTIKGDNFVSLSHDVLVASASIAHEPSPQSHMAIVTPSISGKFVVFWVARESPTTVDP